MWRWFGVNLGRCGLAAVAVVCSSIAVALPAPGQGLFVVSQNNRKVLHYDESNGDFLGTFVEPITVGFLTPAGMAIRPSDGVLYVSSAGTGEIWNYTTATGVVITTTAAATGLIQPAGMGFDATGEILYFVDAEDGLSISTDSVKRLVISPPAHSVVGSESTAEFSSASVNGSEVFASDIFNNELTSFSVSGGNGITEISSLSAPGQVLFLSATELLIADSGSDRVLEYDLVAGNWTFDRVVLPDTVGVDGPFGLALAPDGRLTVSGQFSDDVVLVDLTTLIVTELVAPGAGGLDNARNVAWNGNTLLVSSLATNSIIYYDSSGNPTGVTASGITPLVDGGLAFTPSGNLLASSGVDNKILEYDGQSGAVVRQIPLVCPTLPDQPSRVLYGPDGKIYASCLLSNSVRRFDGTTGFPLGVFVAANAGGLSFPEGLAFGPSGNFYVASRATSEILEYDGSTGAFLSVFVSMAVGFSSISLESMIGGVGRPSSFMNLRISICCGRPVSSSVGFGRCLTSDVSISTGSRIRNPCVSRPSQSRSMFGSRWWAMCF